MKAKEKKSWFGFGAEATVHVWGKPALDREQQIMRLTDITLDVESESAFGLLGTAAKAAIPYVQSTLAVGLMFFSGIQLLSIGVLAEYVARIYEEVKQRPTYWVRHRLGRGLADPQAEPRERGRGSRAAKSERATDTTQPSLPL